MEKEIARPLPDVVNKLYQPFYKGLSQKKILVQKCLECASLQWPPREHCGNCRRQNLHWEEVEKEGTVYTYSVVYRSPHPWFNKRVPFGIVIVELNDGIRVLGNYFGENLEALECGMRLKADFIKINNDITMLEWKDLN